MFFAFAATLEGCTANSGDADPPPDAISQRVDADGDGVAITSGVQGICLLCSVDNAENIIDANLDNFATLSVPLGVAATASVTVTDADSVHPGGTRVGFIVNNPSELPSLDLLSGSSITTYRSGVVQETADGLASVLDSIWSTFARQAQ